MEVQVITNELDYRYKFIHQVKFFSRGFEKFLKQHDLIKRGNSYHTVAVIGAQSSGKSILKKLQNILNYLGTLLNLLFDTRFDTLD